MTPAPIDVTRLLLRFAVGPIFLFSGLEKVVPGTDATVAYFADLGIPSPEILGPAIAWLELVGGVLLLAGVLTRITAALFVSEMAVALLVVRFPVAVDADSVAAAMVAVRLELLIAVAAACLVLLGGGRWSVDRLIRETAAGSAAGPRRPS